MLLCPVFFILLQFRYICKLNLTGRDSCLTQRLYETQRPRDPTTALCTMLHALCGFLTQQLYDPIDAFVSNTSRHVVHRFSDASSR
jgi:hypothetical protein